MLDTNNTTIICIDLQEKLVNMLKNKNEIINNSTILMKAASILEIDTIITEQYPKGLGKTIENIAQIQNFQTFEKTSFSFLQDNKFDFNLKKNVVIFGIETHICVYQSAIDLIEKGYNIFVVKDCSASRNKTNHKTALELIKAYGGKISTLEIVLFEFLKSSKHENFKAIQTLIK